MKRTILMLLMILVLAAPALAGDTSHNGYVVSVNDTTHEVVIAPEGWHPPMMLPPPRMCDESTYTELLWVFYNESPSPRVWVVDTESLDGIYDSWSYYDS